MAAAKSAKKGSAKRAASASGNKKPAKTPGARRKQPAAGKKRSVQINRVVLMCLIVLSWALCIIAEFSMGAAGRLMHGMLALLMGSFTYLFLPLLMFFGFWYIYKRGLVSIPKRWWGALAMFGLFWCCAAALFSMPASDPWQPFAALQSGLKTFDPSILRTNAGLIGSLSAGMLASLFSKTGAWIFDLLFLVLAVILYGWKEIAGFLSLAFKGMLAGPRKAREKLDKVREAAGKLQTAPEESAQEGMRSVIFNGGMQADFSDVPGIEESADHLQQGRLVLNDPDLVLDSTDADEAAEKGKSGKKAGPRKKSLLRKAAPDKNSGKEASGKEEIEVKEKLQRQPDFASEPAQQTQPAPGRVNKAPETAANAEPVHEPAKNVTEQGVPYGPEALKNYRLPSIRLLNESKGKGRSTLNTRMAKTDGEKLIALLNEFGVEARLGDIHIGPSVTKFEVVPGQGVRVNAIVNLQNDIKMALAATDIRIEAPIPGKSAVGIEVPNAEKTTVSMKDLMTSVPERLAKLPLVFGLGKDLLGDNIYGRLDTMPHLLIAGATGSGKSVCVNSIICSILMRTRPDEVKLLLVDPKKVEFTPYNGVPHLLSPVITDGELAGKALKVIVEMMDRRYDLFEETGVRNISSYNAYVKQHPNENYAELPRIVVIIDELADLMLAAPKEVEQSIQRITQLARAAGIHLIVATQRPSVNVITGVIKANIPSRIAFAVSSSTDSRTILDQAGAERLLGYGDMLFLDNGDTSPRRIQGVFIQDEEVSAVAGYARSQAAPMYDDAFVTLKELQSQGTQVSAENADPLYNDVKSYVISSGKASTSLIQRRFSIGYGRAARIMDMLEANGIVGPAHGTRPREILQGASQDEE